GSLADTLELARIPLRPGEYIVITACASIVAGVFLRLLTGSVALAVPGFFGAPLVAAAFPGFRRKRRRRKFEAQLPGALSLIASSLAAGHTFLRAIQMMCEEAEAPLSEEFARVVYETRLGDPVVDALERMARR